MSQAPQSNVHARRFVSSAWTLVIAQVVFALIAVGVTGWAAFRVAGELSGGRPAEPALESPAEGAEAPGEARENAPGQTNPDADKPEDTPQQQPGAPRDMFAPPQQQRPQAPPAEPDKPESGAPINQGYGPDQRLYTP
ncbi:MAG: hypothetical protein AB7J28_15035 [Hyphomonadaceae bacterium]